MPASVMHPAVKENDLILAGEGVVMVAEEEEIPMLPMATNDNTPVSVAKDIGGVQSRQPPPVNP